MEDMKKQENALMAYKTLCQALDGRNWHYRKFDEDLTVTVNVSGDDFGMDFIIQADIDKQLLRILSPLPIEMDEDHRIDGAIITTVASYNLYIGGFDYDIEQGKIYYKSALAFMESTLSTDAINDLISSACSVVDQYNDKFFAVNKGLMTVEAFIKAEG